MHVVEEQIFAIAYDAVKTSYSGLKRTPVLGSSVRPRGKTFAFAGGSDSDDSSDEDDDEDAMEVVFADEEEEEEDDDDDFMARSNHFDCEVDD